MSQQDKLSMNEALARNANMLSEIAGWVTGFRMGSDPERCMEQITKAMQREGFISKGKL